MKIFFAEATGNTFIIADCLSNPFSEIDVLHKILETEDRDDALIISEPVKREDSLTVKYQILGRDKQFGEFCANGARALSAYLYEYYPGYESYFLKTPIGKHPLKKLSCSQYSVVVPAPTYELNLNFISDIEQYKRAFDFTYVEMIEPHLIIKGDISDSTLTGLGTDLNQMSDLFPRGININAWFELENGQLYVKTFERGVQRLTKSCGTGSLSCASLINKAQIGIQTKGGELLINRFEDRMELIGQAIVMK